MVAYARLSLHDGLTTFPTFGLFLRLTSPPPPLQPAAVFRVEAIFLGVVETWTLFLFRCCPALALATHPSTHPPTHPMQEEEVEAGVVWRAKPLALVVWREYLSPAAPPPRPCPSFLPFVMHTRAHIHTQGGPPYPLHQEKHEEEEEEKTTTRGGPWAAMPSSPPPPPPPPTSSA